MTIETPKQSFSPKIDSDFQGDRPILFNYPDYECCFIALNPFLKIKAGHNKDIKFIKGKWPDKNSIIEHCEKVTWTEFLNISGITDYKKLNETLLFREWAIRFCDKNEFEKLINTLDKTSIIAAQADSIPEILENDVLNYFLNIGYDKLIIESEMSIGLLNIKIKDIITQVNKLPHVPVIYTPDEKYRIIVSFDCFFTYYLGSKYNIDKLIETIDLEGFYCDKDTVERWSFEEISDDKKINL